MRTALLLLALSLAACAPTRASQELEPPDCDAPAHTVSVWTNDTGMGVQVCVWVDNGTTADLHVSEFQEWDIDLCGGQEVDVVLPDELSSGLVIPAGESREILGWNSACVRDAATTESGGMGEPALVFAVSTDPEDPACWTEATSPRLTGWYCEG